MNGVQALRPAGTQSRCSTMVCFTPWFDILRIAGSKPCSSRLGGALQQMVYRHKISDTDQLKQVLIDSWAQRSQNTLNQAIDQLSKRLTIVIKAKSGHVEFRLD